ncbi:hypothetical protein EGI26_16040 [Lacihabitans sp. CCS-44]|nr:hypothetical protein [Lacihabitans sp. CCS-44]
MSKMITEILSKEELYDTLKNKFWSTYNLENLDFHLLDNCNELRINLSFYDGYGEYLQDEHEVHNIVLSLLKVNDFEVNFVDKPSITELVSYLHKNREQYTHIGFDPSNTEFKLAFVFGTEEDIRFLRTEFECEKILFENLEVTSKPVKKFLSNDVITIELKKEFIPSAAQIKSFFLKNDFNVFFTEYWGDELSVGEIKQNLNGVFLKDSLDKRNAGIQMGIENAAEIVKWKLYNISDYVSIWDLLINHFLPKINYQRIISGNVIFSREKWEDKSYKSSFDSSSTYET